MKKVFIFLFILLFLIIAGVVVFVLTFDLNRYRPQIAGQLQTIIGNPVTIDSLSLGFKDGIAFELKGLQVRTGASTKEAAPELAIEAISATLQLAPLLRRQIEVAKITIQKPHLHVLRTGDGKVRVLGFNPSPKGAAAGQNQNPAVLLAPVFIGNLAIEDAEIRITDSAQPVPVNLQVRDFDFEMEKVSLEKPVEFEAHAAVAAQKQNVDIEGRVSISQEQKAGYLENVRIKIDFKNFQSEELQRLLPGLKDPEFADKLKGELVADIDRLELTEKGMGNLTSAIQFRNGEIPFGAQSLDDINATVIINNDSVDIKQVIGKIADTQWTAAGIINQIHTLPALQFQVNMRELNLLKLQEKASNNTPQLSGTASLDFAGQGAGKNAAEISQAIIGRGKLTIENPVILHFNLLQEVFGRISMLPRLVETLQSRLPEDYQEKLNRRDTYLAPVDIDFIMKQGMLQAPQFQILSDTFMIYGSLVIHTDGRVFADTILKLDPYISEAFIRSVNELQYLADAEGRLEIPVKIQTQNGKLQVQPDLQYTATKLAVAKTQEIIGNLIKKKSGKEEEGDGVPQETVQSGPVQSDPLAELVGSFLKKKS